MCNRLHSIEQRLARWLLMIRDRLPSGEVHMTHEFLAHVLGVRREGVTLAAHRLQETGLIRYHHGHITILDRKGLEAAACECYRVVKDEFDRLLGQKTPLWRDETLLRPARAGWRGTRGRASRDSQTIRAASRFSNGEPR